MKISSVVAPVCLAALFLVATPGFAGAVDWGSTPADRPTQDPAEIEKRIDRAERLSGKGKFREAEEILDEILASDPLPTSIRRRALTVRAAALLDYAARELNDQRSWKAKSEEEFRRRGRLLKEAVGDLREIVRSVPDGEALEAQRALTFTLVEIERHQEAVGELASYMLATGGVIDPELDRLRRCLVYVGSLPEGQPIDSNDPELRDDLTLPKGVYLPLPKYTDAARKALVEGVVITRLVLDTEGNVVCVKVVRGAPLGLNGRARDAAYEWRFEPARLGGEPVATYYYTTTNFRLQ